MKFHVPDMSCGHCTGAIEKGITAKDPNAEIETDLETHMVTVKTALSQTDVQQAIKDAGYQSTAA